MAMRADAQSRRVDSSQSDDDEESQLASAQPNFLQHHRFGIFDTRRDHVSQGDDDDEESSTSLHSSHLQRHGRDCDSQLIFSTSLQSRRLQRHGANVRGIPSPSTLFDAVNKDPALSASGQKQARSTDSVSAMSGSAPSTCASLLAPFEFVTVQHHAQSIALTSTSPSEIMFAGLYFVGFEVEVQKRNNLNRNIDRFKAFFGVEPTTVAPIFQDLKKEYPNIGFRYALMTLNWYYLYDTYPVLSGRWKYCEETIGKQLMDYGEKIRAVVVKKIIFELKAKKLIGRTVDCTTFKCFEMRLDPSNKWFDYKHHSCGLKYETCMAIDEPQICAINGSHVPSRHDITVFRGGELDEAKETWDQNALYFQIDEDERFLADSGYNGEPSKVVVTKDEHSSEFKEFMARAKNRHETLHTRLKSFNVLGHCFRHGKKH
jgi:hypothetical protein